LRRILFICARNRLRSATAEAIFAGIDGVEVTSAGTASDAECPVSADLIEWADEIYVMERQQKKLLTLRYGALLVTKRMTCLGIPDRFGFMQDDLIGLLKAKVKI
jgi:predicted protein tyrosine phosphatase